MKKLITACLATLGSIAMAQIPTSGLVSRWDFTGGSGADSWGTNNGIVTGATPITDRCGNANSALNFNGSTDQIQMSAAGPLLNSSRSVSFWARTTRTGGPQAIFSYGSLSPGGTYQIIYNYAPSCQGVGIDVSNTAMTKSSLCVLDGNWHHIVTVFDNTGTQLMSSISIYVDGVLQSVTPCPIGNINQILNTGNVNPISISPVGRAFTGDLDDFLLYNKALTATEVQQIYNSCSAMTGSQFLCSGTPNSFMATPVAGATSYVWTLPPGWTGTQTGNILSNVNGLGTGVISVSAISSCGGVTVTQNFTVTINNCCPTTSFPGATVLSGGVIPTGSNLSGLYIINQNTMIGGPPGSINFTDATFVMAPNVQLTVPSGVQVYVDGSHFYSCSTEMWKGITIQNGGQLQAFYNTNNVTLIEDAINAIDIVSPTNVFWPIELRGTIFNKNRTGIKISNSSVTTMPLYVMSCVFTSRDLPFTTSSWPNSSTSGVDLRATINPVNGLLAPYAVQNYPTSNLKIPYSSEPANKGVEIVNIGNAPGSPLADGIVFGNNGNQLLNFNLFDNLGTGIDVTDASLTTMNNVFENMLDFPTANGNTGGYGIRHRISPGSTFNARLNLSPFGALYQSTAYGNRFWDCYTGVYASNVFEISADFATVRSSQSTNLINGYYPGALGMFFETNRYHYTVRHSEFNNLNYSMYLNVNTGVYDMGSGTTNGTYASDLIFNENYFGPQVLSSTAAGSAYSGDAITIDAQAASNWMIAGNGFIQSNKLNRVFRGISVRSFPNYNFNIAGNEISIVDDYFFSVPRQYGIQGISVRPLSIMSNVLSAAGTNNQRVTLVHSAFNSRPFIECNTLSNSFQGFEFEGVNANATWAGNTMSNHARGLVLNTNGQIGQQGVPGFPARPNDNQWLGTWGSPTAYQTFAISSNPSLSQLYVRPGAPYQPAIHGSGGGAPYAPANIFPVSPFQAYICKNQNLPAPPNWRMANSTEGENVTTVLNFEVFPNPSSGNLTVSGLDENEKTQIDIRDMTGKLVFSEIFEGSVSKNIDISSISNGIYLVEIQNGSALKVCKKLVLAK